MSGGPELIVAKGTCYPLFAYEVAQSIDLDAAERRVLAAATERLSVKQKRRAPAYFEYRPAPLRVTQEAESLGLAAYHTAPSVELVLYDFGAISVSYAVPIAGPLAGLAALSAELWGNDRLVAESRRHVERVLGTLGDAAVRPRIADFVEDYSIFQVEAFTTPCEAAALWTHHAQTVAQILRAEPRSLSQQEINDATASRISFGLDDASITRKLQTIDSIYAKMAERAASRRMELLEWIIIVLIALSIIVSLGPALGAR